MDKVRTGIGFFDEAYGGIYRNRVTLLNGPHRSGKTIASFSFLMEGIRLDERVLVLSLDRLEDLGLEIDQFGYPISEAVQAEQLIMLDYHNRRPFGSDGTSFQLPPNSFREFQRVVETYAVQRVVIDPVLPWVALPLGRKRLREHIVSFVRALQRMEVTALLTLPKPASSAAHHLRHILESHASASLTLIPEPSRGMTRLAVNKYLGASQNLVHFDCRIERGKGLVRAEPDVPETPLQSGRRREAFFREHRTSRFAEALGLLGVGLTPPAARA
jgi:KaiC/GvpD/RAD55 family RecA-like ATPase